MVNSGLLNQESVFKTEREQAGQVGVCTQVQQLLNAKFKGINRNRRPPVYCWSQELKDYDSIKMIMEADKAEQLDSLMKEVNLVRGEENENNIKIMAATWNMHGGCPS